MLRCPHPDHRDDGYETVGLLLVHTLDHLLELEQNMTVLANNQAHLDADVTSLVQGIQVLGQEIDSLKQQDGASDIDFSGLDNALSNFNALVTTTVAAPPVVTAGQPVVPAAPVGVTSAPVPVSPGAPLDPANPASPAPVASPAGTATTSADGSTATADAVADAKPTGADPKPLYKHTGANAIDEAEWPVSDKLAADDDARLYSFAGDTGNEATGVSADWAIYTGETKPAPTAV